MYWNYRIMKRHTYICTDNDDNDIYEDTYSIHEVYYDENNIVKSWTENPIRLLTEDPKELSWILDRIKLALEKPVLDYDNKAVEYKLS